MDLETTRNFLKQNIRAKDKEISDLKTEFEKKNELYKKSISQSQNNLLIQENVESREVLLIF